MSRPKPVDKEIKVKPNKFLMSVTDLKGDILRVNDYFCKICGYSKEELIGKPHNIIRHPDMPKAVFYIMWKYIKAGKNITAVVKNLAKDGRYYWVITDFEIRRDERGNINRYMAFRYVPPRKIIYEIDLLYKKLLEIEKADGMDVSLEYLENTLQSLGAANYNEYIKKLENRSVITTFLMGKFKKLFN